jgi:hypothetical protein
MQLSPSWEAASRSAIQEFPNILWNPNIHCHVHKSPPLVSWARSNQSIPPHPISLRSILILFSQLRLGLPSGLLLTAFPPKPYMHSTSPHTCFMPRPSHRPWLDHCDYTWRRVQFIKLLIMQYSPASITSFLFDPNILLSTLFSNKCSSLNVRGQVSQPYRTTGKIYRWN